MPGVTGDEWNKRSHAYSMKVVPRKIPFRPLHKEEKGFFVAKGIAEGMNDEKAKDRHKNWKQFIN